MKIKLKHIPTEKYCICSDESNYNTGRFHAISSVSFPYDVAKELHNELLEILKQFSITEFKWNRLNGDSKYTKCAEKFIKWICSHKSTLRVDTIIWDTNDTRHSVINRDDYKNFSIMYYRLLDHIIDIYPQNITFSLFPDKKDDFDWNNLKSYLTIKNDYIVGGELLNSSLGEDIDFVYIRDSVNNVKPLDSKKCAFIQIADLFAGLAVYSYIEYTNFLLWREQKSQQISLFPKPQQHFSKSQEARFSLLNDFIYEYKIDIGRSHGLNTPAWYKKEAINFWLYKPQRSEDKAPVKTFTTTQNMLQ